MQAKTLLLIYVLVPLFFGSSICRAQENDVDGYFLFIYRGYDCLKNENNVASPTTVGNRFLCKEECDKYDSCSQFIYYDEYFSHTTKEGVQVTRPAGYCALKNSPSCMDLVSPGMGSNIYVKTDGPNGKHSSSSSSTIHVPGIVFSVFGSVLVALLSRFY